MILRSRLILGCVGAAALLAVLAVASLCVGLPMLAPAELPGVLAGPDSDLTRVAVLDLRLPRVVLAIAAGAALGITGALLQDGLRNPIASPELLGVSSGAALVIATVGVFGIALPGQVTAAVAMAVGLAVGTLVLFIGARAGRDDTGVVLIGLAASAFLTGCVAAVFALGSPSDAGLFYQFLLGSLANRSWDDVRLVAPWVILGVPAALLLARPLNALRLGDDVATSVGVRVLALRRVLFAIGCGLTAAVVATCGPIGFVAILAPHAVRRALGTTDARAILPFSALLGGVLLLAADLIGRVVALPREIPAGVWTVAIFGPLVLLALRARAGTSAGRRTDPARDPDAVPTGPPRVEWVER